MNYLRLRCLRSIQYILLLYFSMISVQLQAQTVQIGTGTDVPANTLYSPLYRYTATSTTNGSRSNIIYTQAELAAAGITTGAVITEIAFNKVNTANFVTPAGYTVYMGNTTNNPPLSTTTTWASIMTSHVQVYTNAAYNIPSAPGWVPITLTTPFTYTGGSLEIATQTTMVGNGGATDKFQWEYTSGLAGSVIGVASATGATLNGTVAGYKHRPNIKITFNAGTACVNPATPGTASSNATGTICPNTQVSLSLTGNSTGSGITFQWQSSPDNITYTNIGTPQPGSALNVNPAATTWYRCAVVCSNGTPAYSNAIQVNVNPGLNGTYTINNANPTGGTNFNSFTDAATALSCGITGPVTINVVAGSGPYTEYFYLNNIPGSSATNTVRINGNGATLQYNNTATERHLVILNGTKYLRLDSLKCLAQNATYGIGLAITGGAENDSVTNCTFDISSVTSTALANSAGLIFTGSLTSSTGAGVNGSNCYIYNNKILGNTAAGGPYYGMTIAGTSNNNIIKNNLVQNHHFYGIYTNGGENNLIEGNELNRATKTDVTTFYGIYTTGTTPGLKLSANKIHTPGGTVVGSISAVYMIYLGGDGTAANPVLVSNNLMYNVNQGGLIYAIYVTTGTYNKVYHNTVDIADIRTGTSNNAGIYAIGTNTGTTFYNNNISITGGTTGTKYGTYFNTALSLEDAQKNNIYLNSSQTGDQVYSFLTTDFPTQTAFHASFPAYEVGSPTVNPGYVNPAAGNFAPSNYAVIGTGKNVFADVDADINGTARSAAPTIGAVEVPPTNTNDAAMVSMLHPEGHMCATTTPLEVVLRNAGTNNITTMQVNWSLNGVTQTPFTYNNTLVPSTATGQFMDTVVIGNASLAAGLNTIRVWTSMPNGVADANPLNDTLLTTFTTVDFVASTLSDTICPTGSTIINLAPATGYAAGALEWQSSPDGATWTSITNANAVDYVVSAIPVTTHYRVKITNNNVVCYSNTQTIEIKDVNILTTTAAERCGPGTLILGATANAGTQIKWYDVATGGTPLGTGNQFTTPFINMTRTYYVTSATAGGMGTVGPVSPAAVGTAGGGTASAYTTYHMAFNVLAPTTLLSVDIYPTAAIGSSSSIVIQNSTNVVIATIPYTTTVTGGNTAQTIPLNITLPAGTAYKMGQQNPIALYRNTSGASYPYTSNVINIISNNFDPGYFYYFYNWKFSSDCESSRIPVVATVNENPLVDLGDDIDTCINAGTTLTLDPGTQPAGSTFAWDDNSNAPTREVSQDGAYAVTVMNTEGCTARDTVHVNFKLRPVVNLSASDTSICIGATTSLDAGPDGENGGDYYWTTGATTRLLSVNHAGTYTVFVTSNEGCLTSDTVTVVENGYAPTVNGILALANSPMGFDFSAVNPQNVLTYEWDFGDGTAVSNLATPSHTYATGGVYTIRLKINSTCAEITDSSTVYIVGTGTRDLSLDKDAIKLYPNPAQHDLVIETGNDQLFVQKMIIYNSLGQEVYRRDNLKEASYKISVEDFVSGTYMIHIQTNKGSTSRKFNVIK